MAEDLTKRLYVENVEAWKNQLSKKRFQDRKLEVKVVEHGIILPARRLPLPNLELEGGVCDKDFNFIAGDRVEDPNKSSWACMRSSYTVDRKELVQLDEDVIFGGVLMGHFGHFISQCLNRLWFVTQNTALSDNKRGWGGKILFLATLFGGYKPYFDEFFRLMGIEKERIIYVDKPMQFRSITVPEQSQYSSESFTKEFLAPYQAIKSRVAPGEKKKIYLTRREFEDKPYPGKGMMRCFNEKYFEDFFAAHGFEVIAMEKLSLEKQISLIMGADEIVATMGTLAHWSIFTKPTAKFIMLNRAKDFILEQQCMLNEAVDSTDYYIVDASKNFMYTNCYNGVCMFGANKHWKEFVADYFGEHIDEDDDAPYLEEALDKYINFWCKRYQDPKHFDIWVSSFKNLCNQIIALKERSIKNRPLLTYQTHVDKTGWGDGWKSECQLSNPINQKRDVQAIKVDFSTHKVYYSVYFNDKEGWSAEVKSPEPAGTTGKGKAITGIKVRLDEAGAKEFDICYRVHKFDGSWSDWAKNGAELLSDGRQAQRHSDKVGN